VNLAGKLLRRRDLGPDRLAIPTDHPRTDMQLPKIAGLSAGEAKRGNMGSEARCPDRQFELRIAQGHVGRGVGADRVRAGGRVVVHDRGHDCGGRDSPDEKENRPGK
jgi:hypothetical protein